MAQTFKPDNVTVLQNKNGEIPEDASGQNQECQLI